MGLRCLFQGEEQFGLWKVGLSASGNAEQLGLSTSCQICGPIGDGP